MTAVNRQFLVMPSKDVPALVITSDTDPDLMLSLAGKGIHIKQKPVGIEVLQARIAELTERRSAMALPPS